MDNEGSVESNQWTDEVDLETESQSLEAKYEGKIAEITCKACKKIEEELREYLKTNLSEKEFKQDLEVLCDFGSPNKMLCLSLIDKFADEIYKALVNSVNGKTFCVYVCGKKQEIFTNLIAPETDNIINDLSLKRHPIALNPECELCKAVFKGVEKLAGKHISNEQLKKEMHHACNKLKHYAHKCNEIVNKHGDKLLDLAKSPRLICTMMTMCLIFEPENDNSMELNGFEPEAIEYTTVLASDDDSRVSKGLPKCGICEAAISGVKHLIHHADKNEIKKKLLEFCGKTRKMRQTCENMVNNHADEIIDAMASHIPAKTICRKIGMCH